MIEVEIKLPVSEDLKEKLLSMGFIQSGRICEKDTYYDNADGAIRSGGRALRIRTEIDLEHGVEKSLITFKGKKMDQETVTRPEYETLVEDGNAARKILEELGYYPVQPEVIKERMLLVKDDMTACLDQVQGLGSFLELEILVDEQERESAASVDYKKRNALEKIEGLLSELGYSLSDTTQNSYLSQLQGITD